MTALVVAPLAAVLVVWLLASLASPGASPLYEAAISLTYVEELDLPQPESSPLTSLSAGVNAGFIDIAGRRFAVADPGLHSPFTTEITDDRRTITFLARDIVRDDAASFALYAARRFNERQGGTPIGSTLDSVTIIGERELAGTPYRQPLAVGLIVLGFAIIAVASSSRPVRRAIPAMLHILLG